MGISSWASTPAMYAAHLGDVRHAPAEWRINRLTYRNGICTYHMCVHDIFKDVDKLGDITSWLVVIETPWL